MKGHGKWPASSGQEEELLDVVPLTMRLIYHRNDLLGAQQGLKIEEKRCPQPRSDAWTPYLAAA